MAITPSVVETVLNEYITLLNNLLPDLVQGLYLHGSIALEAYENNSSDIDFITVLNRRLTEDELNLLSFVHQQVKVQYPKPEMDGVYILIEDIGMLNSNIKDESALYPYYNKGELKRGKYFNFNPITWYLFQHKGVKVLGPEISSYDVVISSKQLVSYVLTNMNSYWFGRTQWLENSIDEVKTFPTDVIDTELEWSVLGLLRQFYTLKEIDIVSKLGAGEYGLLHLPEEWSSIIKEAMNIRKGLKKRNFKSEEERVNCTLMFMRYIIEYCNEFYQVNGAVKD
ncbi:DUF4111 domain-containing protein [Bacillus sp. BHET2]|uniref:aminoglycoside adenylyltransferase domain-containing protein n=1 Tax=Bacillus sp. BHET2 TaxID=2583818 RepID=UPI00110F5663|nr:aminoglycoside adenylyltransferase domain-containing protein [Bacillus sp. BHET2]TMU87535.1 DUF4111 domain-containing protein [Bacillus sp. BHET2]